jgi:hypothetical protein
MQVPSSHYVRHGPCSVCGSKDNVAWYSNGTGYCFGCGKLHKSKEFTPLGAMGSGNPSNEQSASDTKHGGGLRPPPDDLDGNFPHKVVEWIAKYELEPQDLIKYHVKWSPSREQLVYLFHGESNDVVLWQARNFREGTTHKNRFFTGGTPEKVVANYRPSQETGTAVLVEDCISAIKIAMSGGGTGIPCFSSSMSNGKLIQIANRYNKVDVWLDNDKFNSSCKLSNRLKLLGCESRVIHTSYDPKEYNLFELKEYIR